MSGSIIVEYMIHFPDGVCMHQFKQDCQSFCDVITKDYIWQKDSFTLQNYIDVGELKSIKGQTDIGENIDDEWFIVYLLFELSKKFQEAIIQISDDDGEFLLIEAADKLPHWLKPGSSKNRIFIHDGKFHIIPIPTNPAEITTYPTSKPTVAKAYNLIMQEGVETCASNDIQEMIYARLNKYPEKAKLHLHYAHCLIPDSIIYILMKKPQLVATAVQAFYERDPLDVKICKQMNRFHPENRLLARVKFTRHLYGQLMQAKFEPERNSPWRLPPFHDKLYKPSALGYKLTCGFEILLARCSQDSKDSNPSGRQWQQYLTNLHKNDFFQNELEGSKRYMELLKEAKLHFKEHFSNEQHNTNQTIQDIVSLMKQATMHKDEINNYCDNIQDEDGDDWMTLTSEELDDMMRHMWNKNDNSDSIQDGSDNLTNLVSSMKSFVHNISSYEGAEIPDEKTVNDELNFDPHVFMDSVKSLLEPPRTQPNDSYLSSDSDSEYSDNNSFGEADTNFIQDPIIKKAMDDMDDELKGSSIPKSFHNASVDKNESQELDVDINLVKNLLESFSSQDGLSGPVSNMLHSMGITLPPDDGT